MKKRFVISFSNHGQKFEDILTSQEGVILFWSFQELHTEKSIDIKWNEILMIGDDFLLRCLITVILWRYSKYFKSYDTKKLPLFYRMSFFGDVYEGPQASIGITHMKGV